VVSASFCRSGRWHGRTFEALALSRHYEKVLIGMIPLLWACPI